MNGVVSKLIWTISMLSSALAVNIGALPYTGKKLDGCRAYINVRLPTVHVSMSSKTPDLFSLFPG